MQANPKKIKQQFKKSIAKYSDNAIVQKLIAEKLSSYLSGKHFEYVLEIGSGSGILTDFISQRCDFTNYYANDLVEKSEMYLRKFIPDCKFFAGDFRKISFDGRKFNLVLSNAVFQWYENLDKIFEQCRHLLSDDGLLCFSTFSPDNFKEIRELTGLTLNYKTSDEIKSALCEYFEIINFEQWTQVVNFDNPLKILAHMKNTGVTSLAESNWGIKEVREFCGNYLEKFPNLSLTYSPITVLAKRK